VEAGAESSPPEPESLGERRRAWLDRARLYLVCEARPGGHDPEELLRPALQGGVDMVQLRDKSDDEREVLEAGRVFRRLCDAYDALFVVNDSPELAIACAADGVHVGQEDNSVEEVREVLGGDSLVGVSTHSTAQIEEARGGADYIAVGPVFRTPTKPEYEPVGLELVRWAAEHASTPFFAIGGIDRENVDGVLDAGADRIAVVRAIRDADDPGEAARELKGRIAASVGAGAPG
jgi:thiamine-phosphate pyrophosphorylase